MLATTAPAPGLRFAGRVYVEAIRNTPLLVQLFIVFFGLPALGVRLSANTAALVALTIDIVSKARNILKNWASCHSLSTVKAAGP